MEQKNYTIADIYDFVPHRPPFLMVDKITSIEFGKSAEGVKLVSANEPYLVGHFPEYPLVPGVMLVECIAQVSGFIFYSRDANSEEPKTNETFLLAGIDKVKLKQQARPGDVLFISTKLTVKKLWLYCFSGTIHKKNDAGEKVLVMSAEVKLAKSTI